MAAQLATTVYVQDPNTRQTVELAPGTSPEPRLAALVTNPAAWIDGKLPRLPKEKQDASVPTGSGPDDVSGGASGTSADADTPEPGSEDTKPAARKTAAKKPARGRTAADEGDGGQ